MRVLKVWGAILALIVSACSIACGQAQSTTAPSTTPSAPTASPALPSYPVTSVVDGSAVAADVSVVPVSGDTIATVTAAGYYTLSASVLYAGKGPFVVTPTSLPASVALPMIFYFPSYGTFTIASHVNVTVVDAIRNDAAAMSAITDALATMSRETPYQWRIGAGTVPLQMVIEQPLIDIAAADANVFGDPISSVKIRFRSILDARDRAIVLHELGHGMGLQHSPQPDSVMYQFASATSFSAIDRLAIKTLFGNPHRTTFDASKNTIVWPKPSS